MKILTVILLILFMYPAIADEHNSLYEKSGGYGKSGGYERSGGYEKSIGGYQTSSGHKTSDEGYKKSQEGYEPFRIDSPERTNRLYESKRYDAQIKRTRLSRREWIRERIHDEGTMQRFRTNFRESGGNDDLINE